ncbi:Uncharacterised protein [uncultured archaeon]|nr:Uncharacterised protein [uncultured archaeon]
MQECQGNACSTQNVCPACQSSPCRCPSMGACAKPPCPQSACPSQSCSRSGCEFTDELMDLADEAWACLMKEKMKAHMEKLKGKKMDAMAAAAVEATMAYWEGKKKLKADKMKFKASLAEAAGKIEQAMKE